MGTVRAKELRGEKAGVGVEYLIEMNQPSK